MMNMSGCIIMVILMILLGFWFYCFLLKIPKHGKIKMKVKVILLKILRIEFDSEYEDNSIGFK